MCIICHEIIQSPMLTSCGHLFCYKCLKLTREKQRCPVCRTTYLRAPFKDELHERKIKNLLVTCSNRRNGCQWKGPLGEAHSHIREASCGHLPVCCPNLCSQTHISFECVEPHLAVCPEQVVLCEYADLGCTEQLKRKDIPQHNEKYSEFHLTSARDTVKQLRSTIAQLTDQVPSLITQHISKPFLSDRSHCSWLQNSTLYPASPWIVRVEKFFTQKLGSDGSFFTDSFYTRIGGYKLCLKVYPNGYSSGQGGFVSLYLCLMKGENDDNLKWPLEARMRVTLLNQLWDGEHCSHVLWEPDNVAMEIKSKVTKREIARYGRGISCFVAHNELNLSHSLNRLYLKDGIIYFRVERIEMVS